MTIVLPFVLRFTKFFHFKESSRLKTKNWSWICCTVTWNGTKYSRMDQVKFVKDGLEKNGSDKVCLSSEICGGQPLKILKWSGPYHVKFFKGCLPQISLGLFLNTLSQMSHGNHVSNSHLNDFQRRLVLCYPMFVFKEFNKTSRTIKSLSIQCIISS